MQWFFYNFKHKFPPLRCLLGVTSFQFDLKMPPSLRSKYLNQLVREQLFSFMTVFRLFPRGTCLVLVVFSSRLMSSLMLCWHHEAAAGAGGPPAGWCPSVRDKSAGCSAVRVSGGSGLVSVVKGADETCRLGWASGWRSTRFFFLFIYEGNIMRNVHFMTWALVWCLFLLVGPQKLKTNITFFFKTRGFRFLNENLYL